MRRELLLALYRQIFEGIYCIHYDINHLYHRLLPQLVLVRLLSKFTIPAIPKSMIPTLNWAARA